MHKWIPLPTQINGAKGMSSCKQVQNPGHYCIMRQGFTLPSRVDFRIPMPRGKLL
jgi:hypothetical protein